MGEMSIEIEPTNHPVERHGQLFGCVVSAGGDFAAHALHEFKTDSRNDSGFLASWLAAGPLPPFPMLGDRAFQRTRAMDLHEVLPCRTRNRIWQAWLQGGGDEGPGGRARQERCDQTVRGAGSANRSPRSVFRQADCNIDNSPSSDEPIFALAAANLAIWIRL